MTKSKRSLFRGLTALLGVLFTIALFLGLLADANAGAINNFLGITAGGGSTGEGPTYYESKFGELNAENLAKLIAEEDEYCAELLEEGSVLLMNENSALPLDAAAEKDVTLFGRASADIVYRASNGGPAVDPDREVTLLDAFQSAGFNVNTALYNAYDASATQRLKAGDETEDIGEEDRSFYTAELTGTFADYDDVAVVTLSRYGGEGADMSRNNVDGVPSLSLQPAERDLLELVGSYSFGKTIVLLNSVYPVDLGELASLGVDACLWIGNPGYYGLHGVVSVLTGAVNPSGHLVDTFAADSMSSPAMQNFGDHTYNGAAGITFKSMQDKYIVNAEGIYVGYKYYETRYEDCILGQGNADGSAGVFASAGNSWNYADEVVYPFGHGLSYTTFSQTLDSCEYDAASDTFTASVTVTNTGSVAGKDAVQLYVQLPYTEYDRQNGVEKSSIQLVAYDKTELLEAGDSETVELTFDRYLLASYDENAAEGYIFEGGNYYFAVGQDVHDALNNILAVKGASGMTDAAGNAVSGTENTVVTYTVDEALDTEAYKLSPHTGEEVSNLFDYVDINTYIDGAVTYLSRSDWQATFPATVDLTITAELYDEIDYADYQTPAGAPAVSDLKYGVDSGLSLADLAQAEYDDPRWEQLVQQMSLKELADCITESFGTLAIESITKPATSTGDGPDGVSGRYQYGDKDVCTGYAAPIVSAASWNKDVQRKYGEYLGEDCLYAGINCLCAPGGNIHRAPYGGRAAEYYSEDAVLTYYITDIQIDAMQSKGVVCAIKHIVLNDTETNRQGVAVYCNEQALREIYLRAYEGTLSSSDSKLNNYGGSLCVMTAYSRVGPVYAAADSVLQKDLLQKEWGFEGFTMTDNMGENEYSVTADMLYAGTDCFGGSRRSTSIARLISTDGALLQAAQNGAHKMLYALANSMMVNGLTSDADVSGQRVWWQNAILGIECVLGVATAALLAGYIVCLVRKDQKEAA